ncbi:hypothetical protein CKAH01_03863 [Colletotrichum kahawae]|uniref:Uncharacterized protein n=1 Tax=Colletotrichum kahawae TaxID=34407 RepID=A0AAD9YMV9_COLKA|nr:hypothetical protein CKAH01_03863 [Colletotrichum kahawae]
MEPNVQADAKVRAQRSTKPNGEPATEDEARSTAQLPSAPSAEIKTHRPAFEEVDSETLPAKPAALELEIQDKILQNYKLDGRDITPEHIAVLKVFARGISAATPEAAKEAARQLNDLCPPLNQTEEANNWMYMVWLVMLDIVADIGSTDAVQEGCVRILEELVQCAKGMMDVWGRNLRVWTDLPVLPITFDEFWENDVQSWKNISCFAARLMRSGLASDYDQAIMALRTALEEDMNTLPGFADCRTQVACLWIKHASPLYGGPATMCLQRWGFWIERLEKLGKEASVLGEDTREMALQTARTIRIVEKGVSHTLSA